MRIWLDDQLEPPNFDMWTKEPLKWDVWCQDAIGLINILHRSLLGGDAVTFIDFDRDLPGLDDRNQGGYDVAKEIEILAHDGKIPPIDYHIHSGNPVGAGNIDRAMKKAWEYWNNADAIKQRKELEAEWNKEK